MTILGREKLIERISNADDALDISPLTFKKQIGATSIDLRMGNVVLMVRSRGASHVDPRAVKAMDTQDFVHELEADRQQKHERYEIPFKSRFLLHPGTLALVPTLEWIRLPNDLHGSVTARSTWAREGLSIATAIFIEPNYHGIITLELSNLGQIPIALYPGMRIAQLAFETVDGKAPRPDEGQFLMSFEPTQGKIAKKDEFPFIPDIPKKILPENMP